MDDFIKELTELSKKYGVYIAGCTCCGSPFIYRDECFKSGRYHATATNNKEFAGAVIAEELTWDETEDE